MGEKICVGEKAPEFALRSQTGELVRLSDFRGRKNVVLFFYPKDFTIGCTREARSFASAYGELQSLGAEVVGVSSDSAESHRGFAESCSLPYLLLSDDDRRVSENFGVGPTLGMIPGRVTYVIDKEGVVRGVFSSQFRPQAHAARAIATLRSIQV